MHHWKKLTTEDHVLIKGWLKEGIRATEIAKRLNNKVSKQRIQQIAQKAGIDYVFIRRKQVEKQHNEKMFAKWGENWKDPEWRKSAIYQRMREKFRNKKAHTYDCEFTVEFGDIEFPRYCPILGIELDYFAQGRNENSPSFDRINPNLGYIKGNVAVISWRANRIKNDGTAEEHEKIAQFIRQAQH
jgi:hypothetical protein